MFLLESNWLGVKYFTYVAYNITLMAKPWVLFGPAPDKSHGNDRNSKSLIYLRKCRLKGGFIWSLLPELNSMPSLKFTVRCCNKNQKFCGWWIKTKDQNFFGGLKWRLFIEDALWDMVITHESCWSPLMLLSIRRIRWKDPTGKPAIWQVVCRIWF